jgi:tRNA(Ile)-lysidine synthase
VILAVSGGIDSMVLLHLVAGGDSRDNVRAVATYDHGTGDAATESAELVASVASALRFPVVVGRSAIDGRYATEAEWRDARWTFLRDVASSLDALVVTAHNRDDQVETVAMRILRGSGARGLAGLLAETDVLRPLIEVSRREIELHARKHRLAFVRDPSNESMRHLRNRVRLQILPALESYSPGFRDELWRIGREAAEWRAGIEKLVDQLGVHCTSSWEASVSRSALEGLDRDGLGVILPAVAARASVTLDRRGTERLIEFTMRQEGAGARMPLSGGAEAIARRHDILIRKRPPVHAGEVVLDEDTLFGEWHFRRVPRRGRIDDLWSADLPQGVSFQVRQWKAGDRIGEHGGKPGRRLKRLFSDAAVAGPEREGWPVVIRDDEIVWVPGMCRTDAATVRSGRPAVRYRCERIQR